VTAGECAGRGHRGVVRGCPLGTGQDCCEWHDSGTADEHDRGSGLAVMAPARAMARPVQGNTSLIGKLPKAARQRRMQLRHISMSLLRPSPRFRDVAYSGHVSDWWLRPPCGNRRDGRGCGGWRSGFLAGCFRDYAGSGSRRCAFRRAGPASDRAPWYCGRGAEAPGWATTAESGAGVVGGRGASSAEWSQAIGAAGDLRRSRLSAARRPRPPACPCGHASVGLGRGRS
jgi:hypothetical protein